MRGTTRRVFVRACVVFLGLLLSVASCQFSTEPYNRFWSPPQNDDNPKFTPDGRKIIYYHTGYTRYSPPYGFHEYNSQVSGLWIMNSDGSGQRMLLKGASSGFDISSDGAWLLFLDREGNVTKARFDGESVNLASSQILLNHPTALDIRWSRDANWIAYGFIQETPVRNRLIYKMRSDGSEKTVVSKTLQGIREAWQINPDWSPEGRFILFLTYRLDSAGTFIAEMDTAGGSYRTLSTSGWEPRYSPDGSTIICTSFIPPDDLVLKIMGRDGSNLIVLTKGGNASWSPDGRKIVFLRYFRNDPEARDNATVWIINADGTGLRQLTYGPRE